MKRTVSNLNFDWLYLAEDRAGAEEPGHSEVDFRRVCLPHTNIELPYHNFSEREHCFVSWYRRHFAVPPSAKGRRVFLDFGAVMIAATVFVNGKQAGPEHRGGYTPFSFDITDLVRAGEDNVVAMRVDSTERSDIPPFGYVVDYLTFGGIYRDVDLRIVDPVHISNIFAQPGNVLNASQRNFKVTAHLVNRSDAAVSQTVTAILRDGGGDSIAEVTSKVEIPAGGEVEVTAISGPVSVELWELETPRLYPLAVSIAGGDEVRTRIGWRTAEFRDDGAFYLNDKAFKLRGLNRHQMFPYIGQAGPARLQRKDAEILKYDLACNIVRTSHYPQSPYFLDRCDEIGLLVLEEIPGWQHIGDEAWKQIAVRDVEAMIVRDRNHPSIILWGVRINESKDDHDFYVRTNALAHRLDPTRQTGGIRFNYESELLEDVYTMNDFQYDLRPPREKKYLNTEFCGHMYPTKTFDQEERVKQHVLHHAHIHNQIGGMASAGGIGWCAFDYNTHAVFGSGDRICYHGVTDIFREMKFAAYFYAAFADPKKKMLLEPASYWKLGDKNGGGAEPLIILSNCDEIEIIVGGISRGRFKPDRARYPNLERPPFVVTELGATWGGDWLPLTVNGFIDGACVATKQISNDGVPKKLILKADDSEIVADGSDMTRVALRITDEFENVLPFAMQPVTLSIKGPGTLVGDNPFPMPGGRGALYVRAGREPGAITVTATTPRLEARTVVIMSRGA